MKKYDLPSYIDLDNATDPILKQVRSFWEGKAKVYDAAPLTEADLEKDCIFNYLKSKNTANRVSIVSFGVATGCRDPGLFMEHLAERDIRANRVVINDIAENMLQVAYARAKKLFAKPEPVVALRGSVDNALLELSAMAEHYNPLIILGIYRSESLPDALTKYNENSSLLGRYFDVSSIVLKDGEFIPNGKIIDFEFPSEDVSTLKNNVEGMISKDQLALRLTAIDAERQHLFTTTYYNAPVLENYLKQVFSNAKVDLIKTDDRNMVVFISRDTKTPTDTLVSMLGGAFGNTPIDIQPRILQRLEECFFNDLEERSESQ